MRRKTWLIAIVTALYVLQVPFCAFACLVPVEVEATAASADVTAHGCHEEAPASSSGSSDVPLSHDDCGCEFAESVLVSASSDFLATSLHAVAPAAVDVEPIDAFTGRQRSILRAFDLPPRDILLLNSTLII